jgi:predicted phosphodiesterase
MIRSIYKVISDIHLEFLNHYDPNQLFNTKDLSKYIESRHKDQISSQISSDDIKYEVNLILAGDIGYPSDSKYSDFLETCVKLYDNVFLIAGNHEFYSLKKNSVSMNEIIKSIENICQNINSKYKSENKTLADLPDKIHFLNNKMILHNNTYIIGSTLWSYVEKDMFHTQKLINDYNCIKNFTIIDSNNLYLTNKQFISDSIQTVKAHKETNHDIKCIVITHHLPSFQLIHPKYISYSDINHFFASNTDDIISEPVDYWIYGHTHTASKMILNNVNIWCNPKGYPSENYNYDKNCIFEL